MNKAINILENIASNAELINATPEQLKMFFQTENSDNEILIALQQNNISKLETALNARTGLVCGLMPAEEPNQQPEEPEPAEGPEKTPVQPSEQQRAVQIAINIHLKAAG